jgi:uncharacterized membrane protein YecN with MAPEG domain
MVTGLYAGLLALIFMGLCYNVISKRIKFGVGLGDGGNEELSRAIRVHGNFAEYVPLALVMILMCEMNASTPFEGAPYYIHLLGGALVLARLLQAYGLSLAGVSKFRQAGTMGTFIVISVTAIILIAQFVIS